MPVYWWHSLCFRENRVKVLILFLIFLGVPVGADQARFLLANRDALRARERIIQEARESICAEYFIISNDVVTVNELSLLREAARRGVDVKLIIDSVGSSLSREMLVAMMEEPHMQIRFFNKPNLFRPSTFTHRNHSKQLNVDGRVGIIGGRNVSDDYFGLSPKRNFVDLDVIVSGEVANRARKYFLELWVTGLGRLDNNERSCFSVENQESCLREKEWAKGLVEESKRRLDNAAMRIHESEEPVEWMELAEDFGEITFYSNVAHKNVSDEEHLLIDNLNKFIAGSVSEVLILTPYLIPTAQTLEVLGKIISAGVRVKILTNSLKSSDTFAAQAGYRAIKKYIVSMGVELYEFNSSSIIHAKAIMVDKKKIFIGSSNLDIRSAVINREIGVLINDEVSGNFSSEFEIIYNGFLSQSVLIGKDGKMVATDSSVDEDVGSLSKIKVKILGILLPLFRNQL